jgi:dihydropteroate synthase
MLDFEKPRVMGILNLTPDSFYDGGHFTNGPSMLKHCERMLKEGADIIDIGGYSSRPGAAEITEEEEKLRLAPALKLIRDHFPEVILSVDTYRSGIASFAINEFGVEIINDISAGLLDENMFKVIASLKVPYIMMHMQGVPGTMQIKPEYDDVTKDLLSFFAERISIAQSMGIDDIIVDPGFGFGKSLQDNFILLRDLRLFGLLGYPIMVGLSRKSMIHKVLGVTPEEALNGTTVVNTLALNNGANILRVHDVREAAESIKLMDVYHKLPN